MVLQEFVSVIMPLNLSIEQLEPILANLICKPMDFKRATKDTQYQVLWPRFVWTGQDWVKLIRKQGDQAADYCDWSKLAVRDWCVLLMHCPQYAHHFNDYSKLSGSQWCWLLRAQPQFADKCDWYKLNRKCWFIMVHERDNLLQYYPLWLKSRPQHEIYQLTYLSKWQKILLQQQKSQDLKIKSVRDNLVEQHAKDELELQQIKANRPERLVLDI